MQRTSGIRYYLIKNLSVDNYRSQYPPLAKGDLGGFSKGSHFKSPPTPPLLKGGSYLWISSKYKVIT